AAWPPCCSTTPRERCWREVQLLQIPSIAYRHWRRSLPSKENPLPQALRVERCSASRQADSWQAELQPRPWNRCCVSDSLREIRRLRRVEDQERFSLPRLHETGTQEEPG